MRTVQAGLPRALPPDEVSWPSRDSPSRRTVRRAPGRSIPTHRTALCLACSTARTRRVPMTRSAASRPEITTGGMPTPGVVPHPASTAFSTPRTRLRGRNGPVWREGVRQRERGPGRQPGGRPVGGGDEPLDLDGVVEPGEPARGQHPAQLRAVGGTDPGPVDGAGLQVRARREHRQDLPAGRREPWVGRGRPGDQQRRVAHQPAAAQDLGERAVPLRRRRTPCGARAPARCGSRPACSTTADGDQRGRSGRRGAMPSSR